MKQLWNQYRPRGVRKWTERLMGIALMLLVAVSYAYHYPREVAKADALVRRETAQSINEWYRPTSAQTQPGLTTWVCKPTVNQGDSCTSGETFTTSIGSTERPWDERVSSLHYLVYNGDLYTTSFVIALIDVRYLVASLVVLVMLIRYHRETKRINRLKVGHADYRNVIDIKLANRSKRSGLTLLR